MINDLTTAEKIFGTFMYLGIGVLALAAIWANATEQLTGLAQILSTIGMALIWIAIIMAWVVTIQRWRAKRNSS